MEQILIKKMEYEYSQIRLLNETKTVRSYIRVWFSMGEIESEMLISLVHVRGMYEDEIKQYIYNYLNKNMERKYIDEI
jgi:hypothetical protein